MNLRHFLIPILLLGCLAGHAQKTESKKAYLYQYGVGGSMVKSTFGHHANNWITRISYRLCLDRVVSDRLALGLKMDIVSLRRSNGIYLPSSGSPVTIKEETKAQQYWLVGFNARYVPIASVKALSIGGTVGFWFYHIVPDTKYFGLGPWYQATVNYTYLNYGGVRLESFVSFSNGFLGAKTIDGVRTTGRSFQSFYVGMQLILLVKIDKS